MIETMHTKNLLNGLSVFTFCPIQPLSPFCLTFHHETSTKNHPGWEVGLKGESYDVSRAFFKWNFVASDS